MPIGIESLIGQLSTRGGTVRLWFQRGAIPESRLLGELDCEQFPWKQT